MPQGLTLTTVLLVASTFFLMMSVCGKYKTDVRWHRSCGLAVEVAVGAWYGLLHQFLGTLSCAVVDYLNGQIICPFWMQFRHRLSVLVDIGISRSVWNDLSHAWCCPPQGRVKSLYSIYNKMMRKKIPMRQVYDARALRVIVDDEVGSRTADAWAAAYR